MNSSSDGPFQGCAEKRSFSGVSHTSRVSEAIARSRPPSALDLAVRQCLLELFLASVGNRRFVDAYLLECGHSF